MPDRIRHALTRVACITLVASRNVLQMRQTLPMTFSCWGCCTCHGCQQTSSRHAPNAWPSLAGGATQGGVPQQRALGNILSAGGLTSLPSSPMTGKAGRPEWFVYDEERTADLIRVLNPNGVSPPRRTCRGTCAEARTVGRRVRDPSQGKHARRGSLGDVGQEVGQLDTARHKISGSSRSQGAAEARGAAQQTRPSPRWPAMLDLTEKH